jgi:hypothetical protein
MRCSSSSSPGLSLDSASPGSSTSPAGRSHMLAAVLTATRWWRLPLGPAAFLRGARCRRRRPRRRRRSGRGGPVPPRAAARRSCTCSSSPSPLSCSAPTPSGSSGARTTRSVPPAGLTGSVRVAGQLFPTYDLAMLGVRPAGGARPLVALPSDAPGRAHPARRRRIARWSPRLASTSRSCSPARSRPALAPGGLAGALQVPAGGAHHVMDTTVIVEAFVVVAIGGSWPRWWGRLGSVLIGVPNAPGHPDPAADHDRAGCSVMAAGADRPSVGPARPA